MSAESRPIPEPDDLSRPFFEGAVQGELRLQRCEDCGTWQFGSRICDECGSAHLAWTPSSGRGRIYSFAIVHQTYHPAFAGYVPYNVSVIEMEEGPRLPATVVGIDHDRLHVGLPVEVSFDRLSSSVAVPCFRACEELAGAVGRVGEAHR